MNRKHLIATTMPAQGRCAFMRVAETFGGRCGGRSNAMHLSAPRLPKRALGDEVHPGEGSA